MLRFIFWSLLAINAALFAYGRGYLGHVGGNEHEPERLLKQLNAEQLVLVPARQANDAAAAARAALSDASKAPLLSCVEIGNFVLADARRFETALSALNLGDRQSRRNQPGTEVSGYIVNIAPQASKEAADKKAAELRGLGVTNYFVMSDSSPMRWAISLGVFKTEAAAQNQLAMLVKQGVHSARITPRMSGSKLLSFQFREVDPELKAKLEKIRADYPGVETQACK